MKRKDKKKQIKKIIQENTIVKSYEAFDNELLYIASLLGIVRLDDLTTDEIKELESILKVATEQNQKVSNLLILVAERHRQAGNDLIKRNENENKTKEIRKSILTP